MKIIENPSGGRLDLSAAAVLPGFGVLPCSLMDRCLLLCLSLGGSAAVGTHEPAGRQLGLVRLPALVPKWLRDRMLCML